MRVLTLTESETLIKMASLGFAHPISGSPVFGEVLDNDAQILSPEETPSAIGQGQTQWSMHTGRFVFEELIALGAGQQPTCFLARSVHRDGRTPAGSGSHGHPEVSRHERGGWQAHCGKQSLSITGLPSNNPDGIPNRLVDQ